MLLCFYTFNYNRVRDNKSSKQNQKSERTHNGLFVISYYNLKRILKNFAANWLAATMQQQLDKTGNDPTKMQLGVRLSVLRKFVNSWLMQTLRKLDTPECVPNNLRGWKESGMLDALKDEMNADHKDFKLAKELNDNGELFMDFTGKKNAKKAEEILKKHFQQHGCVSGSSSRFQDLGYTSPNRCRNRPCGN